MKLGHGLRSTGGRIAIHAGAKPVQPWFQREVEKEARLKIIKTLAEYRKNTKNNLFTGILTALPRGCIIATAELVECWHIGDSDECAAILYTYEYGREELGHKRVSEVQKNSNEYLFGDYSIGRYAWELRNVKMLAEPIPAKGKQRLWYFDLPDDIVGKENNA